MKKMKLAENLFRLSSSLAAIILSQSVFAAEGCQSASPPNPNFANITPSTSLADSVSKLDRRRERILDWYSKNQPLPTVGCREPENSYTDRVLNPQFDNREDVVRLTSRAIARILLKLDTAQEESIFLAPNTKPFAPEGSSSRVGGFEAVGDYDFALVNLVHLYYIAKENDPKHLYFSQKARQVILDKLLTLSGINSARFSRLAISKTFVQLGETENHILSMEISRYLTNQLLSANPPKGKKSADFDNAALGNNNWMLNHLAKLQRDHFYEYNSRPYQGFTINALNVLHTYAEDPKVKLAAQNLLDTVSAWTAVGSNNLRRFAPFRRQPGYVTNSLAYQQDYEFDRFALLVGNYNTLSSTNYRLPTGPHFALNATVGQYRLPEVITDLALKKENASRYFVGKHDSVEIYASSPNALISSGGNFAKYVTPEVRGPKGHTLFYRGGPVASIVGPLISKVRSAVEGEYGWSVPTVVIPTRESSNSLEDMLRFNGNKNVMFKSNPTPEESKVVEEASKGENLCVAEGFACGLQLELGNKLDAVVNTCSTPSGKIPGMRFFNLNQANCPSYGLYLAVYTKPCTTCAKRADSYGFVEVAEASKSTFETFKSKIEASNPGSFASTGVQTYKTSSGNTIKFEVVPQAKQASIIESNGIHYDRHYETWPRARGSLVQSTTPGRLTVDSVRLGKRLIVDMTDPMDPRRFNTTLPSLKFTEMVGKTEGGRYFNDGSSIIKGSGVKWIAINDDGLRVSGLSMGWQSGLNSVHGSSGQKGRLDLQANESIAEVTICTGPLGAINRLSVKTTAGRNVTGGNGLCLLGSKKVYSSSATQQIVAFHGKSTQALSGLINKLGVVMVSR